MSSAWDGLLNNKQITELPHYALGKNNPADAYYTRWDIASQCLSRFAEVCQQHEISLADYIFIEPSAGDGSFSDQFQGCSTTISLDINPQQEGILKADYLRWYPDTQTGNTRKYAVIGNPPFGHRGAIALAFINRSLLFADLVAFILPMSFHSNGKGSNMKRVQQASLIHSEPLPVESFYDAETRKPVSVNTVFQIWRKGKHQSVFQDYDVNDYAEIYTCCTAPDRACGLNRGRTYDCFIASTFYGDDIGIVPDFSQVKYGSGYGIIIKKDKRKVKQALKTADWVKHSSLATNSCRHIRMFHIRSVLGEAGFGTEL